MKENDNENNYYQNSSIENIKINYNNIKYFREVINTKNYFSININNSNYYIHINSLFKICNMIDIFPEEYIIFLFQNKIVLPPYDNSINSFNSISSSKISFSLSDINQIDNDKNENNFINEYIIDDIKKNNNNIYEKEKELIEKKDSKKSKNYNKSGILNKIKSKFFLFKWIYHFYFINGIIIFLHYITFILSEYKNICFYKWITFLLIICLLYVGYNGIKNINLNFQNFIYIRNDLFWINFIILILTMISFIGLGLVGGNFQFIRNQGIIGFFIFFVYITIIIVEAIYVLYYDIINKEIFFIYTNNDNKIIELSVQLYNN